MAAITSGEIPLDGALRSRGQVWGAWFFGGVVALIGLASLSRDKAGQGVVLLGVGLGFILLIGYWPAVWITSTGVRVRNLVRTRDLQWDQIRSFRIGRRKLFPAALIVDLDDGSSCSAVAIQVTNISMGKPDAWERRLARQLNGVLATKRAETGAVPLATQ